MTGGRSYPSTWKERCRSTSSKRSKTRSHDASHSLRRIPNQAFFDKLYVQMDDQIDGRSGEPFNIFFDPEVQQLATIRQRAVETGTQTGQVVGLNNDQLVECRGLEPLTSALQKQRSTR